MRWISTHKLDVIQTVNAKILIVSKFVFFVVHALEVTVFAQSVERRPIMSKQEDAG